MIAAYVYWLGNGFAFWQWTSQNRSGIARAWTSLTSPEGVVIWSALIAVFVLATILVERRADAARDLKWKRRKLKLDYKTARLEKPRRTLSKEQKNILGALQERGGKLHSRALAGSEVRADVDKWEQETAEALKVILGDEYAGMFLHEPIVPVNLRGYQPSVMYTVGRIQTRMSVLNRTIKDFSE